MPSTYQFLISLPCVACVATYESCLSCDDWTAVITHDNGTRYKLVFTVKEQNEETLKKIRSELDDYSSLEAEEIIESESEIEKAPTPVIVESRWQRIKKFLLSDWFTGGLGTVLGFTLLILLLVSGGLPLAAMIAIGAISTVLTIYLGMYSFRQAYTEFRNTGTLTMDSLFVISSVAVILVSIASFFVPWLPMMFETALLIFGFRHLGLAIKGSLTEKMMTHTSFKERLPKHLWVKEGEEFQQKPINSIQCGETVWINAGCYVPLDGIVLNEGCYVFETILTGDLSARKLSQEEVFAGMKLAADSPPMLMQVTGIAADSFLASMDKHLQESDQRKAPIIETSNKIIHYFIPTVLAIAIITGVVIGLFFPPALAIQCAVAVLVSACPCILGMVIPMAVKIGMRKAAEHGVRFKETGEPEAKNYKSAFESLQLASEVNTVVFDVHGTLTIGYPEVNDFKSLDNNPHKPDLLTCAAALEANSKHPVGKAILNYAKGQRSLQQFAHLPEIDVSNHSGVKAVIDEESYLLGNDDLMIEEGVDTKQVKSQITLQAGETVSYLARNKEIVGYFVLSDRLRPEAKQCIQSLQDQGIAVHICSGADKATATRYAKLVGIPEENIAAGCVSVARNNEFEKTTYIKQLTAKGCKVAMVGDGDNDAAALRACHLGIAMEKSDRMTLQEAGAIVQSRSLLPVATTLFVARQTVSNIHQNLMFSLSYNMIAVLLASTLLVTAGFILNPAVGAALMILQMGLIFANAYRFKNQSLPHLQTNKDNELHADRQSYLRLTQDLTPSPNAPMLTVEKQKEPKATRLFCPCSFEEPASQLSISPMFNE